jgi:hypothetical protein
LPQDFVWLVAKPRFAYKRTGEKRPVLHVFKQKRATGYACRTVFVYVRFENMGKLQELGVDINKDALESGDLRFGCGSNQTLVPG